MGDKPLTQDEIDALVSGNLSKEQPTPIVEKSSPAVTISRPVSQSREEAAAIPAVREITQHDSTLPQQGVATEGPSKSVNSPNTNITELAQRLDRVETMVRKLERLEGGVEGAGVIAQQSLEKLQAITKSVQQLAEEVRIISTKLQGTLGYDVYHSFKCDSCSSQETVAISLKCTKCGRESWRGWWPKRQ